MSAEQTFDLAEMGRPCSVRHVACSEQCCVSWLTMPQRRAVRHTPHIMATRVCAKPAPRRTDRHGCLGDTRHCSSGGDANEPLLAAPTGRASWSQPFIKICRRKTRRGKAAAEAVAEALDARAVEDVPSGYSSRGPSRSFVPGHAKHSSGWPVLGVNLHVRVTS